MRAYAIPTISAGANALLSIIFFVGISHAFGDIALGQVVLIQATAAIVLIATMPQSGPYLVIARDDADADARYGRAVILEIAGLLVGFALLFMAAQAPFAIFDVVRDGALLIFWSLAVQGMGSCPGWLRVRERWRTYALWIVFPNLVRVPMILAAPYVAPDDWLLAARQDPATIILWFFLLPDGLRLIFVVLPIFLTHFTIPAVGELRPAARKIGQNWLYDIGSQVTDVADKLVVGAFLGPQVLAAYFFARRIGATTSMVTEPFYWERYRLILKSSPNEQRREQGLVYLYGLALAAGIFGVLGVGLAAALHIPVVGQLVPTAISQHVVLFFAVLLFECMLAANRWSRFLSQLHGLSLQLFAFRLAAFALFGINVALFGGYWGGVGAAIALGITGLIEAFYLRFRMLRSVAPRDTRVGDDWLNPDRQVTESDVQTH